MNLSNDYDKLMYQVFQANPEGEKVFQWLSARYYDTSAYSKGDSHDTAYREGARDVVLTILNMMLRSQKKKGNEDGEETTEE